MKGFFIKWSLQSEDKCVLISGFFLAEFLHCGEKKKLCANYTNFKHVFFGELFLQKLSYFEGQKSEVTALRRGVQRGHQINARF
jgi:hypothetical protein